MNCKVCDNTAAKCPNLSFFRFPSGNERCRDWAERCNILDKYNKLGTIQFYKSFRICSEHFDPKFILFDGRKKRLLYCAVPEIFKPKEMEVKEKGTVVDDSESTNDYHATYKLKLVENLCRLCAEDNRNLTDIFGFRGKTLELDKKLSYLPLKVTSNDVLPSKVCHSCIIKVIEMSDFIANCVKADTKLRIILDLEGCDSTYKVLDNPDENVRGDNPLDKDMNDSEFPFLLTDSSIVDEMTEAVYILPANEPISYDQLLEKLDLNLPNSDGTSNNCVEEKNEASINDDNYKIKDSTDKCDPGSSPTSLEKINLEKEVHFSGHLSLEHDYSNMLKQDFPPPSSSDMYNDAVVKNETEELFSKITGRYSCNVCQKSFSSPEILTAHAKAHLLKPDSEGRFVCQFCDKVFLNRYRLNEHVRVHMGECPYKCAHCPKSFHKFSLLKQHSVIHNTEKPYYCSICNMRSSRRGNLIKHVKSHYKTSKSSSGKRTNVNACTTCLLLFPTLEYLEHHKRRYHFGGDTEEPNQSDYTCEVRLESFPTAEPSEQQSDPEGSLFFTCGVCKKQLESLNSLKYHFKHHTNEPKYFCQFCNRSFKTREICLTHERTHTGETPYECKECGKTFRSRPSFHQHRSVHSTKRLFSCNECGMSFKRKDTLNNHSRIHTGERPFACQICGFAFKQRGDCIKHEKNHKKKDEMQTVENKEDFSPQLHNCSICDLNFTSMEDLNQHQLADHNQNAETDAVNTWEERSYITLSSYSTIPDDNLSLVNLQVSGEHDISLTQPLL